MWKRNNGKENQSMSLNGLEYDDLEIDEKMLLENEEYVKDAIMDIYMSI